MPQWLCNQLMSAFQKKDLRQIRLLNDCWFYYRAKPDKTKETPDSAGFNL
ncbi:cortex morphogenetic protein CmpA [Cohnella terricola]|uniref:Cortex morphogenetic protein CmpA n=1 Tax=Cohnella terricola TaxID=1289167 RepID=A0A559J7U7_9BACL|nr:cortex morphogenetic protein CmpA [Cohnella terricola]TVX95965.1 cortex morphogenetic protein CmpA [Cohnella terricola]